MVNEIEKLEKLLKQAKSIKKKAIIGLVVAFTIIGLIATWILDIINGIQILSTNWNEAEINDSKTLWGIFCFVLLGSIAGIVFGSSASNKLEEKIEKLKKETNHNEVAIQTQTIQEKTN